MSQSIFHSYFRLSLPALLVFISTISIHAQNTDTLLYKNLGVQTMNSYVKFMMMERQRDSCLSEERKFNEFGRVTWIKTNYTCMGWNRVDETQFTYNDDQSIREIKIFSNDQIINVVTYDYNHKGQLTKESRVSYEPADTLISLYAQTLDDKQKLIRESIKSNQEDKQPSYTRILHYKDTLLSKVEIVDDTMAILATYTYYYNAQGQPTDITFESLKPSYSYSKELFDYTDRKLSRMTNTADNTATEFIYDQRGLITQTWWYNRFGQLERIYYNHYTFKAR